MEALLILFAEILAACLAPLFSLLGALGALLLEGLAAILAGIFGAGSGRWRTRSSRPAARSGKPVLSGKAVHWTAGVLALAGVTGVVASVVLFQPILRYVMETAAERAGMEIGFEGASGSLLFGQVALEGVALKRESAEGLAFDLAVARAEADVDLWSLLGREPRIELARVAGVTGFVSPPVRDDAAPRETREGRPFMAELAQASEVEIELRPKNGPPYDLVIETAEVAPFRSTRALFDLLFRSNLKAEVAGQPLSVETREITAEGRETSWRFEEVEADKLKLIVAKAPLTWLEGGTLSAVVEDRWSLSDDFVEMDWGVTLAGVALGVPGQARTGEKVLAAALEKLVAAQGGNASFRYRLMLDKDDIAALRSGDLRRFWDVVLSGIIKDSAGTDASMDAPGDAQAAEDEPGRVRRALGKVRSLLGGGDD